ncbi:MAG: FAD-dependent oxidoreductase [bacterium]
MNKVDHIIVGGGVSGLTAALLLALNGRKVMLLEKEPHLGGSLARFYRQGVPFDTGFHFTGGLLPDALLSRMLSVLGLRDSVEPQFMSEDRAHRFVFEPANRILDLPCGIRRLRSKLKDEFPGESLAVDRYFDLVEKVCDQTATMDLTRLAESAHRLDEETISLKSVLDGLTGNVLLKGVLSGLGMCYGVKPSEVSFASHSRICYDMYQSTARFRRGGDALIDAFKAAFQALGVEVRCKSWITELRVADKDAVESFVLNSGEEVKADSAVMTIHPRHILDLLPREHISKAFVSRVESFEASSGFFTVYGVLDGPATADFGNSIVSLFPTMDFEQMLDPGYRGEQALVICGSLEPVRGAPRRVVTAFEPSFYEHVSEWAESGVGHRAPAYDEYKAGRVQAIRDHIRRYDPVMGDQLRVLDAASMLTFRDYLHSPDGSAYGIKQKVGQYNLIGRLPIRNLFAAGQSALLPGIAGAMMSSFIVIRGVLGKETFNRFVSGKLCS